MEASSTKKINQLASRKDDIAQRLSAAIASEAAAKPVKETARDAGLTEARVKQLRAGDAAVISAPSLILLAQQRPALRSLLFDLLSAECGDSGEHPALVMDRIARLVR